MMKHLALIVMTAAACGGKQAPTDPPLGGGPPPPAHDTRTPLEQRRDTACDQLGPKITNCALADAKADLAAGKVTQKQFDDDTQPGLLKKNTEEFLKTCKVQMSSRQVRVLEVCLKQETECDPLTDCLSHLDDKVAPPAATK